MPFTTRSCAVPEARPDVAIAGGGPVGLYLAVLLLQQGLSVRVYEQRRTRERHSRAIGIHPPALRALALAGAASAMVRDGVPIRSGLAMSRGRVVGRMDFGGVAEDFPFILALPQFRTEEILEERVLALDSGAIVRGAKVTGVADDDGAVTFTVRYTTGGTPPAVLTAGVLVAADGARSGLRDYFGPAVVRRNYPDHYLMGDFAAGDLDAERAVLFLEPDGIVESFPLPGHLRRWVVRLPAPAGNADATELGRLVRQRTGINPAPATNTMLSAFSVRSAIARDSVRGRAVLLGDAAHEISPIGGQGMNLGWLDAASLAPLMPRILAGPYPAGELRDYGRARHRAALVARRQAEINMLLGRPLPAPLLTARNAAVGAAAAVPTVNRWVARRFTMQSDTSGPA
ncbi:FAD-dependent oxidoreductase [Pseudarthrobacter sp. NPDC058362]|uniref:FAD-dependent oxidoreductase n=1 Tax=Pseudarthrobacter sp. NPDC058362 TaxID=3346458 RepID=UPI00365D154C